MADWGIRYFRRYRPEVEVPDRMRSDIEGLQLRVEVSGPRITELRTHHYFEFSLSDYEKKDLRYNGKQRSFEVKVPHPEHLAAAKLGLPADYKNTYDAAALLQISDLDIVIETIRRNDDWRDMVAKRLPKSMGRIRDPQRLEHILTLNAGIAVGGHIKKLQYIGEALGLTRSGANVPARHAIRGRRSRLPQGTS